MEKSLGVVNTVPIWPEDKIRVLCSTQLQSANVILGLMNPLWFDHGSFRDIDNIYTPRTMRPTSKLLATAVSTGNGLKPAPLAILPPIPLYRRLLRAHRKHLPREMRLLGDEYIKSEFRAHRNVDNPAHLIGFLTEWQLYAQKIEGDSWKGEKLDPAKVEKMSDQQIGQMYELMQAIRKSREEGDD